VDPPHPQPLKLLPDRLLEIEMGLAKGPHCGDLRPTYRDDFLRYLGPNLVTARADGRADPGAYFDHRSRRFCQGGGDDSLGNTSPPGVSSGDPTHRRKEHRNTIRGDHSKGQPLLRGVQGVALASIASARWTDN
jgi:hypothetical protein